MISIRPIPEYSSATELNLDQGYSQFLRTGLSHGTEDNGIGNARTNDNFENGRIKRIEKNSSPSQADHPMLSLGTFQRLVYISYSRATKSEISPLLNDS